MSKAFLFDLDGVLIHDEPMWEAKKQLIYAKLFGPEIHQKLGDTVGVNMEGIYEKAVAAGAIITKDQVLQAFYDQADDVYANAPLTHGVSELVQALRDMDYRIGIVSASPLSWITTVTKRLPFENYIELIVSLHERDDLKHKPEPDGYLEAMQALHITPRDTIILEDSNSGIKSAKASGAYTIGLKQNLIDGYQQVGADAYADTMADVIRLVKGRA